MARVGQKRQRKKKITSQIINVGKKILGYFVIYKISQIFCADGEKKIFNTS